MMNEPVCTQYAAPEVIEKGVRGYCCASDWWSLGVLTFEMLYGYSPFAVRFRYNCCASFIGSALTSVVSLLEASLPIMFALYTAS